MLKLPPPVSVSWARPAPLPKCSPWRGVVDLTLLPNRLGGRPFRERKVRDWGRLMSVGSIWTRAESRAYRRRRSSDAYWRSAVSAWRSRALADRFSSRFAVSFASRAKSRSRSPSYAFRFRARVGN